MYYILENTNDTWNIYKQNPKRKQLNRQEFGDTETLKQLYNLDDDEVIYQDLPRLEAVEKLKQLRR